MALAENIARQSTLQNQGMKTGFLPLRRNVILPYCLSKFPVICG